MDTALATRLRATLTERRERLTASVETYGGSEDFRRLIGEVDAALADAGLEDLASFRAGAPRADDLTLMVVRRTG